MAKVGTAIVRSPLVKTALFGGDANWGRIVCAAGYAGAGITPETVSLRLGDLVLFEAGVPAGATPPWSTFKITAPRIPTA